MLPILTDREEQILKLVDDGLTNREISRNLSVRESPIKSHIYHINLLREFN